jgi:transcriptional regulator with XRE-family HTH domain
MSNLVRETIGKRVGRLRRDGGLTQEKLAAKAHIPVLLVEELERGTRKPQVDSVEKLAQALGVRFEALAICVPEWVYEVWRAIVQEELEARAAKGVVGAQQGPEGRDYRVHRRAGT